MTASTDRLPRLLALVPFLRTHPGAPVREVAAFFGVTERQLRDDLDLLWVCGLPGGSPGDLIDLSYEGGTVTLLDPQTLDRPLRLSADEGLALSVAARALADVPGLSERNALDRALAKLEAASAVPPPGAGETRVTVALDAPEDALPAVQRGLGQGRRLHLRYLVETRDEVTERDVDPMRLLSRDGRWYLEGWCRQAEAVRLFRLDRVLDVTELGAAAAPPPEAVPRDLAEGLFRPAPDDLRVTLELSPAARWVADYHPCEELVELPGGGLRVVLRTSGTGWLVRLVLRLGGQGRVVDPPHLAADVDAAASRALARYRPAGTEPPASG